MKKKYSFDKYFYKKYHFYFYTIVLILYFLYFSYDDVIGDILFLGAYIILLLTTIIKKIPKD